MVYRSICTICEGSQSQVPKNYQVQSAYEGETSRSLYLRYSQHLSDYTRASKTPVDPGDRVDPEDDLMSSWMWDHTSKDHNGCIGEDPALDYKFSVVSSHKDALERQITEAIRIEKSFNGAVPTNKGKPALTKCLNRKAEHFAAFPRWNKDQ